MTPSFMFAIGAIVLLGLPSCTTVDRPTATTPVQTAPQDQPSIKTGGSSSTSALLTLLETRYESTVKDVNITQLEPGQSESVIAGVKLNVIDLGAVSKSADKVRKTDSQLEARDVAQDLLVVATHASVTGVNTLTTEQLQGIYGGTISNWNQVGGPDAKIVLLDRPEDESAKKLLRNYYLGDDLKTSPKAVVLRKEQELIQVIQANPYSIGAFSLAYAISHKLPINRLSLNGIEPTPENFKAGKYPMARTISILWHKNPSSATQALLNYISSPPAISAMEESGFIPVTESSPQ